MASTFAVAKILAVYIAVQAVLTIALFATSGVYYVLSDNDTETSDDKTDAPAAVTNHMASTVEADTTLESTLGETTLETTLPHTTPVHSTVPAETTAEDTTPAPTTTVASTTEPTTTLELTTAYSRIREGWDCMPRHSVYGGDLAVTFSGRACMSWQEVHNIVGADNYLGRAYTHYNRFDEPSWQALGNKCRNVQSWHYETHCFVLNGQEAGVEYCNTTFCQEDIDECMPNLCKNGGTCVDEHYAFHCVCADGFSGDRCEIDACRLGLQYEGELSMTPYYVPCVSWDIARHINTAQFNDLARYPEDTWEELDNKCRNPDNWENGPFCVVINNALSGFERAPCDVPFCEGITTQEPVPLSACEGETESALECIPRHGVYAGTLDVTCEGQACANWEWVSQAVAGQLDEVLNLNNFPEDNWADMGSFCRNPGYGSGTPWCFVVNGNSLNIGTCNALECAEDVDECMPNMCMNGATCVDGHHSFECQCPQGYSGDRCQLGPEECEREVPYAGELAVAGLLGCLEWRFIYTEADLHLFPEDNFNDLANKCRNPTPGTTSDAFCYHLNPDLTASPRSCQMPICPVVCGETQECQNGGLCGEGGYECACVSGYTGDNCEINTDECASQPCVNGGTCVDQVNRYTCTCSGSFDGLHCEIDVEECESEPCQHGGNCTSEGTAFTCTCLLGFAGDMCEIDIDECTSEPCLNGGECIDQVNSYTCECVYPYTATHCEDVHSCYPRGAPLNLYKGILIQTADGYLCEPWAPIAEAYLNDDGITVYDFAIDVAWFPDETLEDAGSYCRNPMSFDKPYCFAITEDGLRLLACTNEDMRCAEDVDDCAPGPCRNGGTCVDGVDSFTCVCDTEAGFSGTLCEISDCYSEDYDYKGYLNIASDGRDCFSWQLFEPWGFALDVPGLTDHRWADVANKCRNPYNMEGEYFCLTLAPGTTDVEISHCDIPQCTAPECQTPAGIYAGGAYKNTCLEWYELLDFEDLYLRSIAQLSNFPDLNYQTLSNKCRNPNDDPEGGWCPYPVNGGVAYWRCDIYYGNCPDSDVCAVNPCKHGATCVDVGGGAFTCHCPPGFRGAFCESDDCRVANEWYSGQQEIASSGRHCLPWTLVQELLPDAFTSRPWFDTEASGQYCRSFETSYQVPYCWTLKEGFIDQDFCFIPACQGDVACTLEGIDYAGNFTLPDCEPWEQLEGHEQLTIDLSLFPDDSWQQVGAKCRNPLNDVRGPSCTQLEGSTPVQSFCNMPTCHESVSPCQHVPCLHGGTCVEDGNSFSCQCPEGVVGQLCETVDCVPEEDYYTGSTERSVSGKLCITWTVLQVYNAEAVLDSMYFETTPDHVGQKCRSLLGEHGTAYCNVFDDRTLILERCAVPLCEQDCTLGGIPYSGDASHSSCAMWGDIQFLEGLELIAYLPLFPDATFFDAGRKCRNPNDDREGPWCAVVDTISNTLYPHYCNLAPCQDISPCSRSPCMNGGQCVDAPAGGFTCECTAGFHGARCETDECLNWEFWANGVDQEGFYYFGDMSVSMSGRTCVNWLAYMQLLTSIGDSTAAGSGHYLRYSDYFIDRLNAGLEENQCRQARLGTGAPFCAVFIDGTLVEEDCALPDCPGASTDCIKQSMPHMYQGTTNTFHGVQCSPWSSNDASTYQDPGFYPEDTVEEASNYCRDLYALGVAICLSNGHVEKCQVPQCAAYMHDDCDPNYCLNGATCVDGHASFTCECPPGYHGELCESNECISGIGTDYTGDLNISSRRECLNWERMGNYFGDDSDFSINIFPDESFEALGNKCRNPGGDQQGPFCYVVIGNAIFNSLCALPQC